MITSSGSGGGGGGGSSSSSSSGGGGSSSSQDTVYWFFFTSPFPIPRRSVHTLQSPIVSLSPPLSFLLAAGWSSSCCCRCVLPLRKSKCSFALSKVSYFLTWKNPVHLASGTGFCRTLGKSVLNPINPGLWMGKPRANGIVSFVTVDAQAHWDCVSSGGRVVVPCWRTVPLLQCACQPCNYLCTYCAISDGVSVT
jgi:hypothetical protein